MGIVPSDASGPASAQVAFTCCVFKILRRLAGWPARLSHTCDVSSAELGREKVEENHFKRKVQRKTTQWTQSERGRNRAASLYRYQTIDMCPTGCRTELDLPACPVVKSLKQNLGSKSFPKWWSLR
ncbi:hypothetical protein DPEC_G00251110 [Dallia pectoralis]|uniref:Uncharacterized protein n=1 Tax=Dallia pectoralis TaxID=75939 RepID=A0ACC2FTD6_DALPE|nr:hypothetical protein DPEC_G00251110 [Dallia pectoralis]